MTLQQTPEEVGSAFARNWQQSGVLGQEILERLYEINRIYLDFLALRRLQGSASPRSRLRLAVHHPGPIAVQQRRRLTLSNLNPAARSLLARCPFALFTARFQDSAFWAGQARAEGVRDAAPRFIWGREPASEGSAFADLALFYAWHLAQSNALAARILFGMADRTLSAIRQLPLLHIQQLASEQPEVVTPRWPERSPLWRGLLNLAQLGDEDRLTDIRLLGVQMIASDLVAGRSMS